MGKVKRRWKGGYIWRDGDGRETFVIERRVRKKRFHISTRCTEEDAALEHLRRFEMDPANYRPEGVIEQQVLLSVELITEFHTWSVDVRGNTEKHATEMTKRLNEWATVLDGIDLRRVTLRDHVRPALAQWKGAQHRIIALKSFYAWLRKARNVLTSAEDPTLDLPVPQAQPEKYQRRKAVSWQQVQDTFAQLAPAYRDVLQVLAATGWHVTELERFVRDGDSRVVRPPIPVFDKRGRQVLAVLVTRHKSGKQTRTPIVEHAHLAAAERMKARGDMPRKLNEALLSACDAAEGAALTKNFAHEVREPFTCGVMRHSVATWAVELGASPQDASEYLGHEDKRTTERFYVDLYVPTATIPTRVLGEP
jgi:integrase